MNNSIVQKSILFGACVFAIQTVHPWSVSETISQWRTSLGATLSHTGSTMLDFAREHKAATGVVAIGALAVGAGAAWYWMKNQSAGPNPTNDQKPKEDLFPSVNSKKGAEAPSTDLPRKQAVYHPLKKSTSSSTEPEEEMNLPSARIPGDKGIDSSQFDTVRGKKEPSIPEGDDKDTPSGSEDEDLIALQNEVEANRDVIEDGLAHVRNYPNASVPLPLQVSQKPIAGEYYMESRWQADQHVFYDENTLHDTQSWLPWFPSSITGLVHCILDSQIYLEAIKSAGNELVTSFKNSVANISGNAQSAAYAAFVREFREKYLFAKSYDPSLVATCLCKLPHSDNSTLYFAQSGSKPSQIIVGRPTKYTYTPIHLEEQNFASSPEGYCAGSIESIDKGSIVITASQNVWDRLGDDDDKQHVILNTAAEALKRNHRLMIDKDAANVAATEIYKAAGLKTEEGLVQVTIV